jgi:hypothetical protein
MIIIKIFRVFWRLLRMKNVCIIFNVKSCKVDVICFTPKARRMEVFVFEERKL